MDNLRRKRVVFFKSSRGFKKKFFLRQLVSAKTVHRLAAFRSTIEVMLLDGVLTREEKRLIIRLSLVLTSNPINRQNLSGDY